MVKSAGTPMPQLLARGLVTVLPHGKLETVHYGKYWCSLLIDFKGGEQQHVCNLTHVWFSDYSWCIWKLQLVKYTCAPEEVYLPITILSYTVVNMLVVPIYNDAERNTMQAASKFATTNQSPDCIQDELIAPNCIRIKTLANRDTFDIPPNSQGSLILNTCN